MAARHYVLEVLPNGKLDLPPLGLEPGSEVEVIILDNGARLSASPSELTSLLAEDTLRRLWDNPAEDEAWRGF